MDNAQLQKGKELAENIEKKQALVTRLNSMNAISSVVIDGRAIGVTPYLAGIILLLVKAEATKELADLEAEFQAL